MADESLEEEKAKPGRACEGSRQDLIKCLRESDCVKVVRLWGVVGGWSIILCAYTLLEHLDHIHGWKTATPTHLSNVYSHHSLTLVTPGLNKEQPCTATFAGWLPGNGCLLL